LSGGTFSIDPTRLAFGFSHEGEQKKKEGKNRQNQGKKGRCSALSPNEGSLEERRLGKILIEPKHAVHRRVKEKRKDPEGKEKS